MPAPRKCLTLTNRGEELKAALKALGDRVTHHDADRLYLQVFVDTVVVTISEEDLARLQQHFPALHVEDVRTAKENPAMSEQPNEPPRERCTLGLVGRDAELKTALDGLGPRVTIHDFSTFIGMADVTIDTDALTELQQRFPALEVRPHVKYTVPKQPL